MDNKEFIKDTNLVSYDKTDKDRIYRAVSLKTERLVSAVHLVTGLMDTKEKLRTELRSTAVESMNDLYELAHVSYGLKNFVSDKIIDRISHVVSLLEVGLTGGLISQMNYSILKAEYSKLKDALVKFYVTNGVGSYTLPNLFFGSEEIFRSKEEGSLKDTTKMSLRKKDEPSVRVIKDRLTEPNVKGKNYRQELVVKLIKDSLEYTIKDIISGVSLIDSNVDCSDKTIQRDLLSLVASGVLIKKGERRWSRYSKKLTS